MATTTERLKALETSVATLKSDTAALTARVKALEPVTPPGPTPPPVPPPNPPPPTPIPPPSGNYLPGVVAASVQRVDDFKSTVNGPRVPVTKRFGIDPLPINCRDEGGYLAIVGPTTFGDPNIPVSWDLSPALGVVCRGDAAQINFFDTIQTPGPYTDPNVRSTKWYGLQISDNNTKPIVSLNYCKMDGLKYNSINGVAGPWSGSAIYLLGGAQLTLFKTLLTGIPYDPIKVSVGGSKLTIRDLRCQAYGWNRNSDADFIQLIAKASYDINGLLIDISDVPMANGKAVFPGQPPNSVIFNTIDTQSDGDGSVSFQNVVLRGFDIYPGPNNTPFNLLSLADNHVALSLPWKIRGGIYKNIAMAKGNSGYTTNGGNLKSTDAIVEWSNVFDLNTGAAIPRPVF